MDWIVVLTGNEIDLQELAKVWNSPELTIMKDATTYILKSTHFASLKSDIEVRERANELLIPINAGIILELDAYMQINIAKICQIYPNGETWVYQLTYKVVDQRTFSSVDDFTEDGKREIRNPADPVISLFRLAQSDPQVAKICQYINLDLDSWFTLFNILEILEEDSFTPIMRGGCYKKKADEFTQTANNYKCLGIKARHAKEKTKKKIIDTPKNPMSLSDAKSFIKMLIHEWLETKRN